MITPGSTIHTVVTRNGDAIVDQAFSFTPGSRAFVVHQIWRALDGTSAAGECRYALQPDGCLSIELRAKREGVSVDTKVGLSTGGITVITGGKQVYTLPVPEGPLLFDCDDPMLDWINCIMIVGLARGESVRRSVDHIDAVSGTISRRTYRFVWDEAGITIIKSPDPRSDCRLILDSTSLRLASAESSGYDYSYDHS